MLRAEIEIEQKSYVNKTGQCKQHAGGFTRPLGQLMNF